MSMPKSKTKTIPQDEKSQKVTYSVSEARDNLYSIVKEASLGYRTYEITQRDADPVVMMSKDEFEGWQETLDIMSDEKLMAQLRRSMKDKTRIPLQKVIRDLKLEEENES
jgi:antitoxin YefM